MATCDICGREVKEVFTCRECGKHFCEDDGNLAEMLCVECMDRLIEKQEEADIIDDLQDMEQEE
ncbi:MAG: hypothetical protein J7K73_04125 [Nanoarchaeota archaeon]|nr:hypothetical protein [Nanoarchaeota archaeon]